MEPIGYRIQEDTDQDVARLMRLLKLFKSYNEKVITN